MLRTLTSAALLSVALLAPVPAAAQTTAVFATKAATKTSVTDDRQSLAKIASVLARIRSGYVEQVSEHQLVEAAIAGMLNTLDPHSKYLDAERFEEMRSKTNGRFGGLGVRVRVEDGVVRVVSIMEGTPASRAGIRIGDVLTSLDGEPLQGLGMAEIIRRMRGEPGSSVVVQVLRDEGGQPFETAMTREVILSTPVRARAVDTVGYIRITNFDRRTGPGLEDAVKTLRHEIGGGIAGFVLDLRDNPGGLVTQAVAVVDAFLDEGNIVSTRGRGGVEIRRYDARRGDLANGLPLVVLVNGGSASASEIVAGALQDHRRALLLGEQTYGKGSVQSVIPLGQGSGMKMTTARYYTPSGRSIQAVGITPDIAVHQVGMDADQSSRRRREADLPGALANDTPALSHAAGAEIFVPAGAGDRDFELDRAVELLKSAHPGGQAAELFGVLRASLSGAAPVDGPAMRAMEPNAGL
ncbi:MAG TPA: S41 family peptidase [Arenibaculum sp.]|nr:S41 family peptidase [Arenibaculum sp.]